MISGAPYKEYRLDSRIFIYRPGNRLSALANARRIDVNVYQKSTDRLTATR
jgi:hypothetical protein